MGVICFIRKIEDSGKIALPKEILDMYGWQDGMTMEIFFSTAEIDRIILKEHHPGENLFGERIRVIRENEEE